MVVITGMVVTIISSEHTDTDIKFQMQVAGDTCRPAIADAGSDKKFSLIAVFFPLQVVFAASGLQSEKMSGKHFRVYPFFLTA